MLTEYLPLAAAREDAERFVRGILAPAPDPVAAEQVWADLAAGDASTWAVRSGERIVAVVGARLCHPVAADPEYTYMPAHYALVTPSMWHLADPDAWRFVPDVLAHIAADARAEGIDRLSIEIPADSPGAAVLLGAGFVPDVVLAAAPVPPAAVPPAPASVGPGGAPGSGRRVPDGVRIRPAAAADADGILALVTEEVHYHAVHTRSGIRADQDPAPSRAIVDGWLRAQTSGGLPTLVAESADGLLGVAPLLSLTDGDEAEFGVEVPTEYGYIGSTVVTAAARGTGIGTALVAGLMDAARNHGFRVVMLHYIADNVLAAPFWQARGFTPVTVTLTRHGLGPDAPENEHDVEEEHDD